MPNAEARAAYSDATKLMRSMRKLHEREALLLLESPVDSDSPASRALLVDIAGMRTEWTELFNKYTEAMARYSYAVEQARLWQSRDQR